MSIEHLPQPPTKLFKEERTPFHSPDKPCGPRPPQDSLSPFQASHQDLRQSSPNSAFLQSHFCWILLLSLHFFHRNPEMELKSPALQIGPSLRGCNRSSVIGNEERTSFRVGMAEPQEVSSSRAGSAAATSGAGRTRCGRSVLGRGGHRQRRFQGVRTPWMTASLGKSTEVFKAHDDLGVAMGKS